MDLIAEACLLFHGWTPDTVLQMRATLFFAMLNHGKALARRAQMRNYAELCKISGYPNYTEDSKEELLQFYHDSSLSKYDLQARERLRQSMERQAATNYSSTRQAMEFFRTTSGGSR